MTPRVVRPSRFEVERRAEKAEKLVAYILAESKREGVSVSVALEYFAHVPPLFWAIAARGAGVKMPSEHTITSVLAMLSRAALVEQLVEERRVPTLDHERDTRVAT